MNVAVVRGLVQDFRRALEGIPREIFCSATSIGVAEFPNGCCDDASLLLAAYLTDHGFAGALRVHGEYGGEKSELSSHVWLELDGWIIDITADQVPFERYGLPGFIVEKQSEFHATFSINREELKNADFREYLENCPDALAYSHDNYGVILNALGESPEDTDRDEV